MKAYALKPLINDMKSHSIDKEHFSFTYNQIRFDAILAIMTNGYEILLAANNSNWGCLLYMENDLEIFMPDHYFYSLREILDLNKSEHHFTSFDFLLLLSKSAPKKSSLEKIDYTYLRNFIPYRHIEESQKIYFHGWNDHVKDKRTAHNFDKTEYYFGKSIADYCRRHNISSIWTDEFHKEKPFMEPWIK